MLKCVKCVYYKLHTSLHLHYCLKFNTLSELARNDATKCGPNFKYFKEKIPAYNKHSTNF